MYLINAEELLKHRHDLPHDFMMGLLGVRADGVSEVHLRGERWYKLLFDDKKSSQIVALVRACLSKRQVRIYHVLSDGTWKRM